MPRPSLADELTRFPSNEDIVWLVVGWALLYAYFQILHSDGSDSSIKNFDDSRMPNAVLIGWAAVYWLLSRLAYSLLG